MYSRKATSNLFHSDQLKKKESNGTHSSRNEYSSKTKMERRLFEREEHRWKEREVEARKSGFDSESSDIDQFGDDERCRRREEDSDGMCSEEIGNSSMSHANSSKRIQKEVVQTKLFSSENNTWKPAELMANSCYDKETGVLLSKESCERNLNKMMKSKKSIDFYEILKTSSSPEARTLSFSLYMLDKIMKRPFGRVQEEPSYKSSLFDVQLARNADKSTMLPGNKKVTLSLLFDESIVSSWVGARKLTKSIVAILNEICLRDPFFMVYSVPESNRPTTYPKISRDFFLVFSRVIQAGFGMELDSVGISNLDSTIKTTTRNYIDKRRGRNNAAEVKKLLEQFENSLKYDAMFRGDEPSLENSPVLSVKSVSLNGQDGMCQSQPRSPLCSESPRRKLIKMEVRSREPSPLAAMSSSEAVQSSSMKAESGIMENVEEDSIIMPTVTDVRRSRRRGKNRY